MKAKKQKLVIEHLLGSPDLFITCNNIIQPQYFDPEYRSAVKFIKEYYDNYHSLPATDLLAAEFDITFVPKIVTKDEFKYTCTELETFCKQSALRQAIYDSLGDVEKNELGAVQERIKKAMEISLHRDVGLEFYDEPEAYLKGLIDTMVHHSTGITALDMLLNGGLIRKQTTLFSANSGVGKSNMLLNLASNFSINQGFNVLYLSLELPVDMLRLRMSFMQSRVASKTWKQNIPEIAGKIINNKSEGAGSIKIKRIANGSTANDVRSILKQYELEHKYVPDVLCIDYLDIMNPIGGTKNKSISDQDKEKSEQLSEIVFDYDMIGLSASQQNRGALDEPAPNQSVIAGGLTKVNSVDNYFSMFMNEHMRLRGDMTLHALKTRSSDGVGKSVLVNFNTENLLITDSTKSENQDIMIIDKDTIKRGKRKGGKVSEEITKSVNTIVNKLQTPQPTSAKSEMIKEMTKPSEDKPSEEPNDSEFETNVPTPKPKKQEGNPDSLLDLMQGLDTLVPETKGDK
jgi:hypothetical protein